jgi:hypothetical protein
MHLAKIPEMKSISKPRFPIEIHTLREILSTNDCRKKLRGRMAMSERFIFIPLPKKASHH